MSGPRDILLDEEAIALVNLLRDRGYSADEVVKAMEQQAPVVLELSDAWYDKHLEGEHDGDVSAGSAAPKPSKEGGAA